MSLRVLALIVVALALAGCRDDPAPARDPNERARVVRAIDALRKAPAEPHEARRALLDALSREPAGDPNVVRARDTCANAHRLLFEGIEAERRVEAAMKREEPPTPALADEVIAARRKLKLSERAMVDCDEAAAALR